MKQICFGSVAAIRVLKNNQIILDRVPGGNGFYAYLGLSLSDPDTSLAAGIGADFASIFGQWMANNEKRETNLVLRTDYCNYFAVALEDCIQSPERSVYGKEAGKFYYAETVLFPQQFLSAMEGADLAVFCERIEEVSLKALLEFQKTSKTKFGWLVPRRMIYFPREDFIRTAKHMDFIALSVEDAAAIFNMSAPKALIEELIKLGTPFYLTDREGAYLCSGEIRQYTPWQQTFCGKPFLADLGGRESASAAAMAFYLKGASPKEAGLWGSWSYACQSVQLEPCDNMRDAAQIISRLVAQEMSY